jgi:hypothetical protein
MSSAFIDNSDKGSEKYFKYLINYCKLNGRCSRKPIILALVNCFKHTKTVMKRCVLLIAMSLSSQHILAQLQEESWLLGYDEYVTGSIIGYKNAVKNHGSALLVRSLDEQAYIEWKTEALPEMGTATSYTFAWMAGYDSVKVPMNFKMFLNGKHYFTFTNRVSQRWVAY